LCHLTVLAIRAVDPADPAFQVNRDLIRIQGFDDQKRKKKNSNFFFFFDQKLQFTYVQATGEAFSHRKRASLLKKMKFMNFFRCFCVAFHSWIRIRIANSDPDTDPGTPLNPDPQHCSQPYACTTLREESEPVSVYFRVPGRFSPRLGLA
jgi:hypothetical protein